MSETCSVAELGTKASILSPRCSPEHGMTTSMQDPSVDVQLNAAPLPRNMSSWVSLDMEMSEGAAPLREPSHDEAGGIGSCALFAKENERGRNYTEQRTPVMEEVTSISLEPPVVTMQLLESESRYAAENITTQRMPNAAILSNIGCLHRPGVAVFSEKSIFPHRCVSTVWPLLTTPSEIRLPMSCSGPCVQPDTLATTRDTRITEDCFLVPAIAGTPCPGPIGFCEHPDPNADPLHVSLEIESAGRVDSLPSSLPMVPPHSYMQQSSYEASTDGRDHGTGTTSYTTLMEVATNSILTPHIISVATTSLASDGEQCLGECRCPGLWTPTSTDVGVHGEHTGTASRSSTLQSSSHGAPSPCEDGTRRFGEEVTGSEAEDALVGKLPEDLAESEAQDFVSSTVSHTVDGSAEQRRTRQQSVALLSWRPKPLLLLRDQRRYHRIGHDGMQERQEVRDAERVCAESTPAPSGRRKAALWISRRMSFISSSSMASSILSSTMASTTFTSTAAAAAEAAAASTPSSRNGPHASSPIFAVETSRLWSEACILCLSSSQRALRGLHQLCDYVWQDLKHHWYPQLRLVLGDHSSAHKLGTHRRSHRRFKSARTPQKLGGVTATRVARTSATAEAFYAVPDLNSVEAQKDMHRRSSSSPSFFNHQWHHLCDTGRHQCITCWERSNTAGTRHHQASSSSNSTCTSSANSPRTTQSAKEGLHVYAIMTAEAVVSAAQGLLVFLL